MHKKAATNEENQNKEPFNGRKITNCLMTVAAKKLMQQLAQMRYKLKHNIRKNK